MKQLESMDYMVQIIGVIGAIQTIKSYKIGKKLRLGLRVIQTAITLIKWLVIAAVVFFILSKMN